MSSPVFLYKFHQAGTSWLFTNSSFPETHESVVYMPRTIKHGNIEQSEEFSRNTLNIEFARDDEFAFKFLGIMGLPVSFTLFRKLGTVTIEWKGRVSGAKISDTKITLTCESLFSSLKQPGLRSHYTIECRHALYGPSCGVSRSSKEQTLVIKSVEASNQFTVFQQHPNDFFTGGIAEIAGEGLRMVASHTNNQITLNSGFKGLYVGAGIRLSPGCNHTTDCASKFNNFANFGGYSHFPNKNPFEVN